MMLGIRYLSYYFHTIRYLRWEQVFFRLYYKVSKPCLPAVTTPFLRVWSRNWNAPMYISSRLTTEGHFSCLQQSAPLSDPNIWQDKTRSKLWLYHLHYFDVCRSHHHHSNVQRIQDYIEKWLTHNPPLKGVGWEPYPISLRVVNWIIWLASGLISPPRHWLVSLIIQAELLLQRIEYHLLGNHLLANAKALIFLGCYFDGERAEYWLQTGLKILDKELQEQFVQDGAHFELSPMYHALLLWDLCDICYLARTVPNSSLQSRIPNLRRILHKGLRWLAHMNHPDGEIGFFNDAALHAAPTYKDLYFYLQELGFPFQEEYSQQNFNLYHLRDSGYIAMYLPNTGKMILDVAPIGPTYQPGHAHADTLSFELSLFGQRVIVNSGISEYGTSPLRTFQRSTKAHNTVCIDNSNSSEIWAGFRVAKRAYPLHCKIISEPEVFTVQCAHNGYARAPYHAIHQRQWIMTKTGLTIYDTITSKAPQHIEARFYFHPDVHMMKLDMRKYELVWQDHSLKIEFLGTDLVQEEDTHWYPALGTIVRNRCLVVCLQTNYLETKMVWE